MLLKVWILLKHPAEHLLLFIRKDQGEDQALETLERFFYLVSTGSSAEMKMRRNRGITLRLWEKTAQIYILPLGARRSKNLQPGTNRTRTIKKTKQKKHSENCRISSPLLNVNIQSKLLFGSRTLIFLVWGETLKSSLFSISVVSVFYLTA